MRGECTRPSDESGFRGVRAVDRKQVDFPKWLDRAMEVGSGCLVAFLMLMMLPGLVAWALSGDADLGRRVTRAIVGWAFGPACLATGSFWFVAPYWGSASVLAPPRVLRWAAVCLGSLMWGVGVGISAYLLGGTALRAARVGLCAVLAGLMAGCLMARWLEHKRGGGS